MKSMKLTKPCSYNCNYVVVQQLSKIYSCSKNISNNSVLHKCSPSRRLVFSFQLINVGITLKCASLSLRNGFFRSFQLEIERTIIYLLLYRQFN